MSETDRGIDELHDDIQGVEERLAEQVSEIRQNTKKEIDRLTATVDWLVNLACHHMPENMIADTRTGKDLRPEWMAELQQARELPRGKL